MAAYRAFLTGEPGCGKTTVVKKVCDLLQTRGRKVGGMISGEIRGKTGRVGFSLENVLTHERGILAHVGEAEGPRVGKYRINLSDIERIGVAAIKTATSDADVIVVDEIGPMELNCPSFVSIMESALKSPKPIICTIHKRASHPLVSTIRSMNPDAILEVTQSNRDGLPTTLVNQLAARA